MLRCTYTSELEEVCIFHVEIEELRKLCKHVASSSLIVCALTCAVEGVHADAGKEQHEARRPPVEDVIRVILS